MNNASASPELPVVVVFAGPTIDAGSLRAGFGTGAVDLMVEPPAARGDVLRAVDRGAHVIGLIDGFYEHQPATWHKEILWAIEQGIRVYGSSSMGAIRAAECGPFGMVGIGSVFAGFAADELDDDDVAIAHASAADGYATASEAMVNIHATVAAAVDASIIDEPIAGALRHEAKRRFYPARTWDEIELATKASTKRADGVERFRTWRLRHGTVDVKRRDAELLINRILSDLASDRSPSPAAFRTTITAHFERMRREERSLASRHGPGSWRRPLLEELQMQPAMFMQVAHEATRRGFARHVGMQSAAAPERASIDAASDRLRRRLGLLEPDALWSWLDEHELTFEEYSQMVDREYLAHVGDQLVPTLDERDLLDVVRLLGLAERLRTRAESKAELLRRAGVEESGNARQDPVSESGALAWFCSHRLKQGVPEHEAGIAVLAHRLGFADVADFLAAVRREHQAHRLGLDDDAA